MNKSNLIKRDFDKIALHPSQPWDTNSHYYNYLLQKVPTNCMMALDLGCGKGAFCHELKLKAKSVIGIDLSPKMIKVSNESVRMNDNISFQLGDYLKTQYPAEHFDCIVSIATVHHMPLEKFLTKASSELKTNGRLIILDLYKQTSLIEYFLSFIALPLKKIMSLTYNGTCSHHTVLKKLWIEHGKNDTYMSLKELKKVFRFHLPGFLLKRHLFWRYSLIWTKEAFNQRMN